GEIEQRGQFRDLFRTFIRHIALGDGEIEQRGEPRDLFRAGLDRRIVRFNGLVTLSNGHLKMPRKLFVSLCSNDAKSKRAGNRVCQTPQEITHIESRPARISMRSKAASLIR